MHSEITTHQFLFGGLMNKRYWNDELPYAPVYDKNGVELHNGDIVAESEVGKIIWDGWCRIVERPLGRVKVYKDGKVNIFSYKPGKVEAIIDIPNEFIKNSVENDGRLYLSTYDGVFFKWDNIEIIKEQ